MAKKRAMYHSKVTTASKTVKLDRERFSEYCRSLGHTETSLSKAYSTSTYIGKRFKLYDGTFSLEFINWCNKTYPWGEELLNASVVPEPEPEPEQIEFTFPEPEKKEPEIVTPTLPSVIPGKIITVQSVSLVGINKVVDALKEISERLRMLEEAWNGHRE